MSKIAIIITFILIFTTSCSHDDVPLPVSQNKAPLPFELISPDVNAMDESRIPTFTWEKAVDPEDDQIDYDLYIGNQGEPTFLVAEKLSDTFLVSNDTLDFNQKYQWMVMAKDAKGAKTNSPMQSFMVQPAPIAFLRRHSKATNDKYYEYSDEGDLIALEDINQDSWTLKYDAAAEKLERIYMGMQTAFVYSYTKEGRQETVGKFSIGRTESWKLEYNNDHGSLASIKHLVQEIGGTNLDEEVTFVYEDRVSIIDTASPKLSQILIGSVTKNGTISKKIDLEWIGENISKITVEIDSPDGFILSHLVEYEYDNNINPYHTIIKEQFGFDTFYVNNIGTGLETINFGSFFWQSKNNITKIKKTEQDNGVRYITYTTYDYTYTNDYYPLFADVANYNDLTSMRWSEEWSY